MPTLFQLFRDYPGVAVCTAVALLVVTVLPLTRGTWVNAIVRTLAIPFRVWAGAVTSISKKSGWSGRRTGTGRSTLVSLVLPVMECLLVLGGIMILASGIISGWHASVLPDDNGRTKAALGAELSDLKIALTDTRSRMAELDREWARTGPVGREAYQQQMVATMNGMQRENELIESSFSRTPRAREYFSEYARFHAGGRPVVDVIRILGPVLPSLPLTGKERTSLLKYFENCRAQEEMALSIGHLADSTLRRERQPGYEQTRRLEAELLTVISRIEGLIDAPVQVRRFDTASFLEESISSMFGFYIFVWALGYAIELMGGAVASSSGPAERTAARQRTGEAAGPLFWAE
jgi:hypothetical protein